MAKRAKGSALKPLPKRKSRRGKRAIGAPVRRDLPGLFIPAWFRARLKEFRGASLAVLLAYASHADAERKAWPSLELLQQETGYDPKTVKAAKKKLIKMGVLIAEKQERVKGGRKGRQVCTVGLKLAYGSPSPWGKNRPEPWGKNWPTKDTHMKEEPSKAEKRTTVKPSDLSEEGRRTYEAFGVKV